MTPREEAFLRAHEAMHRLYLFMMQDSNPLWMWSETKQSELYHVRRQEQIAAAVFATVAYVRAGCAYIVEHPQGGYDG